MNNNRKENASIIVMEYSVDNPNNKKREVSIGPFHILLLYRNQTPSY